MLWVKILMENHIKMIPTTYSKVQGKVYLGGVVSILLVKCCTISPDKGMDAGMLIYC